MVINRLNTIATLEKLNLTQSELTGAMINTYIPVAQITIAIKKSKSHQVVQGVREDITYYTGVTRYKGIKEGINRLSINGVNYWITDVRESNLYSVLDLTTIDPY